MQEYEYRLIDPLDANMGVTQTYLYGDLYSNLTNATYKLTIRMLCQPQIETLSIDRLEVNENLYTLTVYS